MSRFISRCITSSYRRNKYTFIPFDEKNVHEKNNPMVDRYNFNVDNISDLQSKVIQNILSRDTFTIDQYYEELVDERCSMEKTIILTPHKINISDTLSRLKNIDNIINQIDNFKKHNMNPNTQCSGTNLFTYLVGGWGFLVLLNMMIY